MNFSNKINIQTRTDFYRNCIWIHKCYTTEMIMENIQLKLILFLMCVFMCFISLYQLQERVWVCVQSFNSNSKTNKNLEVMHGVIPTTLYLNQHFYNVKSDCLPFAKNCTKWCYLKLLNVIFVLSSKVLVKISFLNIVL